MHSESDFPLATGDVDSLRTAGYVATNGKNLNGGMRDGKAQLDATPGKRLARQNAHRPDHGREEQCPDSSLFKKKRAYSPTEVRADLYANVIILN
jgi:hypothetical protein